MSKLQKFLDLLFSKTFLSKFLAYFLLILFFIIFKNFIGIIILTFIFGFLFFSLAKFFKEKINFLIEKIKNKSVKNIFYKVFSLNFIIIFVYLFFIGMIVWIVSRIIPKLIFELTNLPTTFPFVADYVNDILHKLKEIMKFNHELGNTIKQIANSGDFGIYIEIYNRLKGFSIVFFKIILSLLMSFIFLMDREKLGKYLGNVKKSNFSFFYYEYKIIFDKVLKTFGVILKAQATIAFVNAILTTIGLLLIGFINGDGLHYPFLLTLSLIVFFAGFIPVLGTFISSVPIILVGYSHFSEVGIFLALEIIILISIIHFIEAYFLNPKIVSKALSLPISITFVILIFSEQLFGMAGLLLGISLFYFILGVLGDIDKSLSDRKKFFKN